MTRLWNVNIEIMALCKYWKVCMKKCSQDCEDFEPESYIAEHEDIWYEYTEGQKKEAAVK